MRQVLHIILLTAMIWILCCTSTAWGQSRSSPKFLERVLRMMLEDRNAYSRGEISEEEYNQRRNDILRRVQTVKGDTSSLQESIDSLEAHGDYTQLKLIVRSRKTDYNPGEPVWLQFSVRNDSDSEVHVYRAPSTYFRVHYWKLFHSNYDEVAKTPKFEEKIQEFNPFGKYGIKIESLGGMRITGTFPKQVKLQPGQEYELDWRCLNDLFDLSKPDTYELTCFTTSVIRGQEYRPPLQSNTLTFRILEEPSQEPIKTRESPDVPYTNPLPGEEVFKQPKPPKNVFYIHNNFEPYIEIIEKSPYMHFREWREKMVTPPPDDQPPDESNPPAE